MSFENLKLDKRILDILKENKLQNPTEIQLKTIPVIMSGNNIVGVSKTGTGKTLSFLIPIISRLLQRDRSFYCLIITPTRELAIQINKNVSLFESLGVRSNLLIGGEQLSLQVKKLKEHPHIIIGTPGRIHKHIGNLKLSRFKILVLDEADRFFEEDYKISMKDILSSLKSNIQKIMTTATITESLRNSLGKEKIIDVSTRIEKLKEFYYFVPRRFKECFLFSFCNSSLDCKIMIFVNMRVTAMFLSYVLKKMNIENDVLTGEQKQVQRENVLDGFRSNKYNVLVSTDVGSRGIDIPDVDYVINFDIPTQHKDYTHRIGRTARAEMTGSAITLVTQYDLPSFQRLEHDIGGKINLYNYEKEYKIHEEQFEEAKDWANKHLKEEKQNKPKKTSRIQKNKKKNK